MSYQAIVAKLEEVKKHPNADRLQLAKCLGYSVVVGLNAKEGDTVLLFPDDGQLSEEYCKANDLVGYTDPVTGEKRGGYFDKNRRVRAQTFRGEKSEAYIADLDSLLFADRTAVQLAIGTRISELNGVPICNKYVNQATKAARQGQVKQVPKLIQRLKELFPEHIETDQLRYARDEELIGLITLTGKLHGTSQRSALLKIKEELPQGWLASLLKFTPKTQERWMSVYGTRRVIKGEVKEDQQDYRAKCHRLLQPHIRKGEVW